MRRSLGGEIDPAIARRHLPVAQVHRQASQRHRSRCRGRQRLSQRIDAPKHGLHAQQQLLGQEGLNEVVVGTEAKPGSLVHDVASCRQEENRRHAICLPQVRQRLETVHLGHHDVQGDQVGPRLLAERQHLEAVCGLTSFVPRILQKLRRRAPKRHIIVGHDNNRPTFAHRSSSSGWAAVSSGSSTTNWLPQPSSLLTSTDPPTASA